MIVILMGVSGAGKTTIGELLAQDLGWPFYDGDDFHPPENIAKMSRGISLTDDDRTAWLAAVRQLLEQLLQEQHSAIFACSALKASYRKQLKRTDTAVQLVYLKGDYELIQHRLRARHGHFMKADLLASQFAALEEPMDIPSVEIDKEPREIVSEIKQRLGIASS